MPRFTVTDTPLQGLRLVQRQRLEDARGFFSRFFCAEELAEAGFDRPIAQINHSVTRHRGAVRGMHFQHHPHAEDKFVSCLHGEIFDVAVDLRRNSPTFLHWHAEILSKENARSLLVPKGFAHGFQALSEDAELLYFVTSPYAAAAEDALNARDPILAIAWPIPITELSERDANHVFLSDQFNGV